jgi:hypothetical protein
LIACLIVLDFKEGKYKLQMKQLKFTTVIFFNASKLSMEILNLQAFSNSDQRDTSCELMRVKRKQECIMRCTQQNGGG